MRKQLSVVLALTVAATVAAAPVSAADRAAALAKPVEVTPISARAAGVRVSDQEVDKFARAVVLLNHIQADPSLDADSKQDRMEATVVAIGIDPERYNEIGSRCAFDNALRTRVESAMAKYSDPGPDVV